MAMRQHLGERLRESVDDALAADTPEAMGWTRAEYLPQEIPEFDGNPFIEALPPTLGKRQALAAMRRSAPATPDVLAMGNLSRMHVVARLKHVVEPLGRNLELYYAMDVALRRSYVTRNPRENGHGDLDDLERRAKLALAGVSQLARDQSLGLSLMGESALGKSMAAQVVAECCPRVILHEHHRGKPFRCLQVPWLVVGMPKNGSTKDLLPTIFAEFDSVLKVTNYHDMYTSGNKSEGKMLGGLFRIARLHGLGGLIPDEIQNLNQGRGTAAAEMMNLLTVLSNVIRVAVVPVGDETSVNILGGALRQARRSSGVGMPVFERLPLGADFSLVCKAMWDCVVLRNKGPLTPLRVAFLYELSQGYPGALSLLLMTAQETALMHNIEELSEELLSDTHERRLPLMMAHTRRARGGRDALTEAQLAKAIGEAERKARGAADPAADLEGMGFPEAPGTGGAGPASRPKTGIGDAARASGAEAEGDGNAGARCAEQEEPVPGSAKPPARPKPKAAPRLRKPRTPKIQTDQGLIDPSDPALYWNIATEIQPSPAAGAP